MKIAIKTLSDTAIIPSYACPGDAGFDLCSDEAYFELLPNRRKLVGTGLAVAVPYGYEMQIRPRSGHAYKRGLTVLNSPGTIDCGYRGEVGVLLYNASDESISISRGDRIAQGVIAPVITAEFIEVEELDETDRGEGGFGHTGA